MITPQEALEPTPKEAREFEKWEERIDESIQEYYAKWGCNNAVVPISGVSCRVREALIKAYRAAGWQVTYHDDQRDGASLRFEPAPSRQVENEQ